MPDLQNQSNTPPTLSSHRVGNDASLPDTILSHDQEEYLPLNFQSQILLSLWEHKPGNIPLISYLFPNQDHDFQDVLPKDIGHHGLHANNRM